MVLLAVVVGTPLALLFTYRWAMSSVYRTNSSAPSWSARAEAEVELPVGRDEAFIHLREAVSRLRLLGPPQVDPASGAIEARVFGLWRTMGDLLTLQLEELDAHRVRVRIQSRPILPQRIDYGASRSRVDDFKRSLEATSW